MNLRSIIQNPGYYYNRLFQEVEFRTGISCSKPSEVWLKLTERCNCRCQMCDIWRQNRSAEGELNTQDWKKVLSGLRQWLGSRHIWFTGGEAFLRPDCIDLIRYANSLGLSIGVITNGILLKAESMPLLIEAGLKEYHVSIDSVSPQIHDHLRGIPNAHKRATENVLALKECLNKNGKDMKIVIKTIIMGYNAKEILPLVEWVDKNQFDEIKFQPLESNLEARDALDWFNSSPFWAKGRTLDELCEMIDELITKKQAGANIHNSVLELKNMREYFLDPVGHYEQAKNHTLSAGKQRAKCKAAMTQMEILSKGGLRLCRKMPPQGDIRTTTPRKFWKDRIRCWRKPAHICLEQRILPV